MINIKHNHQMSGRKNKIGKKFAFIFLIGTAFSQSFAQHEITKYTINSGGGFMTSGNYELSSSIAQVDASSALNSNSYVLNGGFWHKNENNDLIFKNGFE